MATMTKLEMRQEIRLALRNYGKCIVSEEDTYRVILTLAKMLHDRESGRWH